MPNILRMPLRRAGAIVIVAVLAALITAACADDGDTDGLTDGVAEDTPTTTIPGEPADEVTPAPDTGDGGGATGITLDDVQAFVVGAVTDVDAEELTRVDFSDGVLTVETVWDGSRQTDAEDLCDQLLGITTGPPVESVTVRGADGSTLADCTQGDDMGGN